jgi:hypothetical protein
MSDAETPNTPDTLPPAATADTLPPPAGDELPSPRASVPPMLTEAHVRILQLPIETIEALLQVIAFLKTPGRGARFDALPSGAIDVMLAGGYGSPEAELSLGYDVSKGPDVETALGTAALGAFRKFQVVR